MTPPSACLPGQLKLTRKNRYSAQAMQPYRPGPMTLKIQIGFTPETRYTGKDIMYIKGAPPSIPKGPTLPAAKSSVLGT